MKYLYLYKSQDLETSQVLNNRGLGNELTVYICNDSIVR